MHIGKVIAFAVICSIFCACKNNTIETSNTTTNCVHDSSEDANVFATSTGALSVDDEAYKMTQDGLVYEILDDHVVISGYVGSSTQVSIPETIEGKDVTEIGEDAFEETVIETIDLTNKITIIGDNAFNSCPLKEITLPDSVTYLGEFAFYCSDVQKVVLPKGLESIQRYTFYGCDQLREINIPDSVLGIDEYAFIGCISLKEIVLPANTGYALRAFNPENGILIKHKE